ncbi:MAG: hypothetical protein ABR906_01415 [Terracidiphilus sp.]|jgi:hypothetical protein
MATKSALIVLLALTFAAPPTAFCADTIKNTTAAPLPVIDIENGDGKVVAHLFALPGETIKLNSLNEPAAGAGFYQAMPGEDYFIWILPKLGLPGLPEEACPCALHMDKIGWDRAGKLTTVTGLRPYLVTDPDRKIAIVSPVAHPRIANGRLYFKLAGYGSGEFWVRTSFAQVVETGGPWGMHEVVVFVFLELLPLMLLGLLAYAIVSAIRLSRHHDYEDKSYLELMRLSLLRLLFWRRAGNADEEEV